MNDTGDTRHSQIVRGSINQPLLVVVPQGEERRPSPALITIVKHQAPDDSK